jgi:hypothetical protein
MNPFLSTLVLLAGVTGASSGIISQQSDYQVSTSRSPLSTAQPQVATSTVIMSGDSFAFDPSVAGQAQENVLVVPMPDLPAESVADLTEDLTVMCRIFGKAVPAQRTGAAFATGSGGDLFRYYTLGQRSPQALYLDGYGALFFIHVDFPLVPTEPREPAETKPQEPVDSVWAQTIEEMSGRQKDKPGPGQAAETYDPQKVENLKKTLVKTLAHASNLRMRRPQDVVTVVVGAVEEGKASSSSRSRGAGAGLYGATSSTARLAKAPPAAALLVLRVTKAEVDAFAKGQLTPAQFAEKVQILWSPAAVSAPAAGPAPTPVNSHR